MLGSESSIDRSIDRTNRSIDRMPSREPALLRWTQVAYCAPVAAARSHNAYGLSFRYRRVVIAAISCLFPLAEMAVTEHRGGYMNRTVHLIAEPHSWQTPTSRSLASGVSLRGARSCAGQQEKA